MNVLLKQDGIKIDERNAYGNTPLYLAAQNGYEEVVKVLLKKQYIDINAKTNSNIEEKNFRPIFKSMSSRPRMS